MMTEKEMAAMKQVEAKFAAIGAELLTDVTDDAIRQFCGNRHYSEMVQGFKIGAVTAPPATAVQAAIAAGGTTDADSATPKGNKKPATGKK